MKNHTDPNSWERVLTEKKVGTLTNLLQEPKQGRRGLMVYPEHTCVGQGSKNKLCIFNTVERSMIIHDLESNCRRTIQTTPLRKCKKTFHSQNPLAFTFTPNFNVAVSPFCNDDTYDMEEWSAWREHSNQPQVGEQSQHNKNFDKT
jgi:hypothetical protein